MAILDEKKSRVHENTGQLSCGKRLLPLFEAPPIPLAPYELFAFVRVQTVPAAIAALGYWLFASVDAKTVVILHELRQADSRRDHATSRHSLEESLLIFALSHSTLLTVFWLPSAS